MAEDSRCNPAALRRRRAYPCGPCTRGGPELSSRSQTTLGGEAVSVKAEERVMVSERIAPGMLIYAISEVAHRTGAAAAEETLPDQIHLA